jgi:hypothetical protein
MSDNPLANMRIRMEQCRRLAALTKDLKMSRQLNDWADEIALDIERLKAEIDGRGSASADAENGGQAKPA